MQSVFQRHELKYLLSPAQKEAVLAAMHPYMRLDCYGRTTIRNIYFDTDDYRLIRRSLERPVYKEKLRLRSYHAARADEAVFVELKKKYFDVVYKRRISLAQDIALRCLNEGSPPAAGKPDRPGDRQLSDVLLNACAARVSELRARGVL